MCGKVLQEHVNIVWWMENAVMVLNIMTRQHMAIYIGPYTYRYIIQNDSTSRTWLCKCVQQNFYYILFTIPTHPSQPGLWCAWCPHSRPLTPDVHSAHTHTLLQLHQHKMLGGSASAKQIMTLERWYAETCN